MQIQTGLRQRRLLLVFAVATLAIAFTPSLQVQAATSENSCDLSTGATETCGPRSFKLPDGRQRAFPTAEGFGAGAAGGRGGRVIFVTSLRDGGDGSLRACIEAVGPRNCVFRVGGTIVLTSGSLKARSPFVTIAGETAPGGGIALRNGPAQLRPSLEILTNDVIVRHIRLRPGPHKRPSCCSGALGLYTNKAKNIIIDHVSASWGSDETIDSQDASDYTIQWSLIGEPLLNGGPTKKNRGRNMLLTRSGNLTLHHNLFATGVFRNPQVQTATPNAIADIRNNVFYSPVWDYVVSLTSEISEVHANVVGNYKISGMRRIEDHLLFLFERKHGFAVYLQQNRDEPYRRDDSPEANVLPENLRHYVVSAPFPAPPVATDPPEVAYRVVLAGAGATKPKRDSVDARLVKSVRDRTGKLLKADPMKVGGWPALEHGEPYPDRDADGMDDRWEKVNGLASADGDDASSDNDGDGWTNLEEFFHFLAGDRM